MSELASPVTTTSVEHLEYRGETAPRRPAVAVLLSYLCPGLGYMYAGHLLKGITVNLLFVLLLEAFIIALSVWKFFPLAPFGVLIVAWLVFSTLVAMHVLELLQETPGEYVLRPYNHWVLYTVVAVLTYVTPIAVTTHFTMRHLWGLSTVESAAMYPLIQPGDTVLIDRTVYHREPIRRGDLVVVRAPTSDGTPGESLVLRVVGLPDDIVRIEGTTLYLNDEPLHSTPLAPEFVAAATLEPDPTQDMHAWIEDLDDRRYVISYASRIRAEWTYGPTRIEADQLFLLADNRSMAPFDGDRRAIRDSRNFGAIDLDRVEGKPVYIGWSSDLRDGHTRWNRIGLRTE